jgi:sigma-B regulation protein RsbU (phosphoserine phosphatase)
MIASSRPGSHREIAMADADSQPQPSPDRAAMSPAASARFVPVSTAAAGQDWRDKPWPERLSFIVDTMRELSSHTDPQAAVRAYVTRLRAGLFNDGAVSVSRRDLAFPWYRITRSTLWKEEVDPWRQKDKLPLYDRGILGQLLYDGDPLVIDDLQVPADDPAYELLKDMRSAIVLPSYENGVPLNMTIMLCKQPGGFDPEVLPEQVWMSNLFGRATRSLVLSAELKQAYETVNRELKIVADIQRSLLPTKLPEIPGVELAAYYQTSTQAGGDYYDFFPLPDGRLGVLIADVSGHGTPAAVMMAVTHSIAHTHGDEPTPPSRLLSFINRHLAARYTNGNGTFVTAFYGIYDPATRELTYSNAGHNPPRIRCGEGSDCGVRSLEGALSLPLGIIGDETYTDATHTLAPGETLVLYTDGITEARGTSMEMFELQRLDEVLLAENGPPQDVVRQIIRSVEQFTQHAPAGDDRTLLLVRATERL